MSIPRGDNWDDLRFVLEVHRHGSIVAAARALGVNEVTVTRRIHSVEQYLGASLFERERGRAVATRETLSLIDRLAAIADDIDAVRTSIGGANSHVAGVVRVTGSSLTVNRALAPRLPELIAEYPELELELVTDTARLGVTHRRETDIAVRLLRPSAEVDAVTRKIGDVAWSVYASRALVEASMAPDWIAYARRSAYLPHAIWIEEQRSLERGSVRARVDDVETLVQCVRAGLGKSLLPCAFGDRFPELMRLDGERVLFERELWMLVHPSMREVRRYRVVADWIDATIKAYLAGD